LKLCAALRILVQHHINDQQINTAEQLIQEYGAELIKVLFLSSSYHTQYANDQTGSYMGWVS
jgi:hypothetical protein